MTCIVCHLQEGKIVGVQGIDDAPHATKKLDDPNQICVRCHVVGGEHWDTFFSLPPCGTVAEISAGFYDVAFTQADTNGDVVAYLFDGGVTADVLPIVIRTVV